MTNQRWPGSRDGKYSLARWKLYWPVTPSTLDFSFYTPDEIRELSVTRVTSDAYTDVLGRPADGGVYDLAMGPSPAERDLCKTCGQTAHFCPGHFGRIELPVSLVNPLCYDMIYKIMRATCFACHRFKFPEFHRLVLLSRSRLIAASCLVEASEVENELLVLCGGRGSEVEDWEEESTGKQKVRQVPESVKANLDAWVQEKLSLGSSLTSCRSSVISRQELVKEFLGAQVRDKCPNCGIKKVGVALRGGRFLVEHGGTSGMKDVSIVSNVLQQEVSEEGGELKKWSGKARQNYLLPKGIQFLLRKVWEDDRETFAELFPFLKASEGAWKGFPTDSFFLEVLLVPPPRTRPLSTSGDRVTDHPLSFNLKEVVEAMLALEEVKAEFTAASNPSKAITSKMDDSLFELQNVVNRIVDSDLYVGKAAKKAFGIKQIVSGKEGLWRSHVMGKRVNHAARSVITPDPIISVEEIGIPKKVAMRLSVPEHVTVWNLEKLREMVLNGPDVHPGAITIEAEDGRHRLLNGTTREQRETLANSLLTPALHDVVQRQKVVHRHLQNGDTVIMNRQPTLHRPSMMTHRVRVLPKGETISLHYANCSGYNADFDGDEMNCHVPQNLQARAEACHVSNVSHNYLVPKNGCPLQGLIQDHVISGALLTMRGTFFERAEYIQLVYSGLTEYREPIQLLPPGIVRPKMLWSGKQIISTLLINLTPKGKFPITFEGKARIPESEWTQGKGMGFDGMGESQVVIRQGELVQGILDKNTFGSNPFCLIHCTYELFGGGVSSALLSSLSRLFTTYLHHHGFSLGYRDILCTAKANKKRSKINRRTGKLGPSLALQAVGEDEGGTLLDKLETFHRSTDNGTSMKRLDAVFKKGLDKQTNEVNSICMTGGLLLPFPQNNLQLMVQSGAKGSKVNMMQMSSLLGQMELEGRRPPLMISGKSLPSFLPYDTGPKAGGFISGRYLTGIGAQELFFHCQAGREGLVDTAVKTSRSGYLQRSLIKLLEGVTVAYDSTVRDCDGSVIQFRYGEDSLDVTKVPFLSKSCFPFLENNWRSIYDEDEFMRVKASSDVEDVPEPVKANVKEYVQSQKVHGLVNRRKMLSSKKFRQMLNLKVMKSRAEPGEPVGLLAAQSIGEPSTQMTLNTFHFAGRSDVNVTMGIPRLREILMTASQKPKTPSMEIPVLANVPLAQLESLKRSFTRIRLSEVLSHIDVKEDVQKAFRVYSLRFEFLPLRSCLSARQILEFMETRFFKFGLFLVMKKLSRGERVKKVIEEGGVERREKCGESEEQSEDLVGGGKSGAGEDEEMEEDVEEGRRRPSDDADYDGEEEELEETGLEDYGGLEESGLREDEGFVGEDDFGEKVQVRERKSKKRGMLSEEKIRIRIEAVKEINPLVDDYHFDVVDELWCRIVFRTPLHEKKVDMWSTLKELAHKAVISEVPGVSQAFVAEGSGLQPPVFTTDGINLSEIFKYDRILDLRRLKTNDIYSVAATYGIEAATSTITRELQAVFGMYGIQVDYRHLSLVSNFMTFDGTFRPFSRYGMELNPSPIQQISFETPMNFLKNAIFQNCPDSLDSPSARLTVGQLTRGGTGCVQLMLNALQTSF